VIERRGVVQVLLDDIGGFARFTTEAEGGVGELLFVRSVAAECAGGELLVFAEMHRANVQRRVMVCHAGRLPRRPLD